MTVGDIMPNSSCFGVSNANLLALTLDVPRDSLFNVWVCDCVGFVEGNSNLILVSPNVQ
jgi:hypothetical protein